MNNNHNSRAFAFSLDTSDDVLQHAYHLRGTIVATLIIVAQTIRMVHQTMIYMVLHTQDGHLTMSLSLGNAQMSFQVDEGTFRKFVCVDVLQTPTTFLAAAQSG
jgi:hypothetical protein